MYFIGCTRFSLYIPGSNAWHIAKISQEDYLAKLYSDERLTDRFEIFFNKAMPIYAEMARHYAYNHIIQYSSHLPQKWKERLHAESKKYSFIVLSESGFQVEPLPIIELLDGKQSGTVAYFRVDDDDVLSTNYLKSLACYTNSAFEGMLVSFGNGLIASYQDGRFNDFRLCHRRFLALGLAYIGHYDADQKKYWLPKAGDHETVDKFSPTVIDSREPMFVWTHHRSQDTKLKSVHVEHKIGYMMSEHKRISSSSVYSGLFPTLKLELETLFKHNEAVVSVAKIELNDDKMGFDIGKHKQSSEFFVDYCITDESLDGKKESQGLTEARSLVICFDFEEEQKEIKGLTLSTVSEIGWFTYVALTQGIGARELTFRLSVPSKIKTMKLIKWKSKGSLLKISSLKVIAAN